MPVLKQSLNDEENVMSQETTTATQSESESFRVRAKGGRGGSPPPNWTRGGYGGGGWGRKLVALGLILGIGYVLYFWEVRRVVVDQGHVLVVLKKNGSRSLKGDQIIIPHPPKEGSPEYAAWQKEYGDCNGILEQVYPEGTYFAFSPFDYERYLIKLDRKRGEHSSDDSEAADGGDGAIIPADKVGIVVKKFGKPLDPGQVLADPARDQRGPLPTLLRPGRYNEYANPFAYEIKHVPPLVIDPGYRGVVTIMAGKPAGDPNQYLVKDGEQGTQQEVEPEGFKYVNPFEKRIMPISVLSQRFAMSGNDVIKFPSADSFDIQLEGFVEWSADPQQLPLIYVQYGEGGSLIEYLEEKVILPYARSFCRLVGSQYNARDFISGDTKLKFQAEFEQKLRDACAKEGIIVKQALVRDIEPPVAIKQPINEREIAKEQILQYDQQIKVARSMALLTTQEETAVQNGKIGEKNKEVVTITKKAEQERDVALTKAQQDLAVAKLKLEAAQKQADAQVARGKAEADVILLKKQAEAEPLRQQITAFGDGETYARYFFYQQVAPSIKSILTNTEGPFADVFRQFVGPTTPTKAPDVSHKVTEAQP
jgi:regulator of protease activity HflC (stomatin/prohibitin superfamily)